MKPTPRQQKLIEEVLNQAHFWMNTNDLDSPTHYCDIEEEMNKLEWDEVVSKEEKKKFEDLLCDLLDYIKSKKY
jgi:hypothetical protein